MNKEGGGSGVTQSRVVVGRGSKRSSGSCTSVCTILPKLGSHQVKYYIYIIMHTLTENKILFTWDDPVEVSIFYFLYRKIVGQNSIKTLSHLLDFHKELL